MAHATTDGAKSTRALAAALADLVVAGDCILLAGELGAGKTAFVQGLGEALGITEPITSPTFTLARHYEGRLTLHHLDVYRLERFSELSDVGLGELIDSDGLVVIEWGDAVADAINHDYLEILIAYGEEDDDRSLAFRCVGATWQARERSLAETLENWITH